MTAAIVVLAAGSGSRVGAGRNKVLLELDGMPLLAHSVLTALSVEEVSRVVLVVRPAERDAVAADLAPHLGDRDIWIVAGGAERHDSEHRALEALRADIESGAVGVVAIHDGARPLATATLFRTVIDAAARHGAAVPGVPVGRLSTADGARAPEGLVAVQTPQAFDARAALAAYDAAAVDGFTGTDTAACLERYSDVRVRHVPGEPANLKVTFAEDLPLARELLRTATG